MKIRIFSCASLTILAVLITAAQVQGQSRHERKAQAVEESAKVQAVAGGVTVTLPMSYEKACEAIREQSKRDGVDIETSDCESGRLVTSIAITGGWKQTGTRTQYTIMKDDGNTTATVRVAVSEQKRFKGTQTEPWGAPKLNEEASQKIADQLKLTLGKTVATASR